MTIRSFPRLWEWHRRCLLGDVKWVFESRLGTRSLEERISTQIDWYPKFGATMPSFRGRRTLVGSISEGRLILWRRPMPLLMFVSNNVCFFDGVIELRSERAVIKGWYRLNPFYRIFLTFMFGFFFLGTVIFLGGYVVGLYGYMVGKIDAGLLLKGLLLPGGGISLLLFLVLFARVLRFLDLPNRNAVHNFLRQVTEPAQP